MSDETKRIIDQPVRTSLSAGDYVIVDNQNSGSGQFDLGSELGDIKSDLANIDTGGGLTADIKSALLQLASKVAYIDDDGQDYYNDLYDALYAVTGISISPSSISLGAINATSQLTATTVPAGGSVTWSSSNTSIATVSSSGLVTAKGYGSATITASSGSVSATCSVLVAQATLSSISAVYTQSGTVYDSDTLDSLKTNLVVTAHWSNNTTSTVASTDYTLSGTLTVGTSTITVSYGGKTTTFTVTVTANPAYTETTVTLENGTDFTTVTGSFDPTTGADTESTTWDRTSYISVPSGTTSFAVVSSIALGGNNVLLWYDSNQDYIGVGSSGTYGGNGQYGDGFTADDKLWHAVPSGAAYCRLSWKNTGTLTSISFRHNIKLDESITPVVGKIYYYTWTTSAQSPNTDDYLSCSGMAYLHARVIQRRGINFYDGDKIQVSTIATANNIGNNVIVPSGAVYVKVGNTDITQTNTNAQPTRKGIGLIEFTSTTVESW